MNRNKIITLAVLGWTGCYLMFCQSLLMQQKLEHQQALVEHHKAMADIYSAMAAKNSYTHTTVLPPEVINGY